MSLAAAQAARTAKSHALFERLVEVSKTARTPKEQAEALGVPAKNIKFIRHRARRAGFDIDSTVQPTTPAPEDDVADDAAMMSVPRQADGPRSGKWSREEDLLLRNGYRRWGPTRVAELLGRKLDYVHKRASILGVRLRARWLAADDRRLEMLWGSASLEKIAKQMNRSENACYARGRDLGLGCGTPQGCEWITHAAERTGYHKTTLARILAWAGVKPKPAMSDPKSTRRDSPTRRVGVFDQSEVDEAVERWLASEVLSEAAHRRGYIPRRFWYLLTKSGVELPPKPDQKKWWRIPTATIERAMEIMASREYVVVAAKRVGVKASTLATWLKAANVPRDWGYRWFVDRATIDRVVAENQRRIAEGAEERRRNKRLRELQKSGLAKAQWRKPCP